MESLVSSFPAVNDEHHPSAEVLPLFAPNRTTNSVPPPPSASFPEHESTTGFDFARLEQNLHHHIDARFDRLTRVIVEQSDKIMDQVAKMIGTSDRELRNGLGNSIRRDLVTLRNDFVHLGSDLHTMSASSSETRQSVQSMVSKVSNLEATIREAVCKCGDQPSRQNALLTTTTESEETTAYQQTDAQTQVHNGELSKAFIGANEGDEAVQDVTVDNDAHQDTAAALEPNVLLNSSPPTAGSSTALEDFFPPSFLRIGEDGQPEVITTASEDAQDAEDMAEALAFFEEEGEPEFRPPIRMPNGVLYELPDFMRLDEHGQPMIIPEPLYTAEEVAEVRAMVEGIDGATDLESAITSMLSSIRPSERSE